MSKGQAIEEAHWPMGRLQGWWVRWLARLSLWWFE